MSHSSLFSDSASSFFQNVVPKPGVAGEGQPAPAGGGDQHAPASSSGPGGGSMLTMLLPFLILVPFLFMSFRRQKKESEARKGLKKGDKVVTQAGLIGELVEMDTRIAKVKIAPGTTVQVLASTVSMFDATAVDAKGNKTDKELADLKEAKAGGPDKK